MLSIAPPDDAGAETADRYHWQAMMAAADVLALYFNYLALDGSLLPDADFTLVCEHHEDWVVVLAAEIELVSAKHREASVGPFSTVRQLLGEGGVLHLYRRWLALQKTPQCRLVTTCGLSRAAAKMDKVCEMLRKDIDSTHPYVTDVLAQVRTAIFDLATVDGVSPPQEREEDIRTFLSCLRIAAQQPRRDFMPDLAAERYGKHVAEKLGMPHSAHAVWQTILNLVQTRMRAAGETIGGALPTPFGRVRDDPLASRSLRLLEVDVAARFAANHAAGYRPLPRIVKANLMAVKMTEGGCSDNAVERADELRLRYREYWRVRRAQPSVVDQQRRIGEVLLRVIDETTDDVRTDGMAWGPQLWRSLDLRLREIEGHADAHGLSADLLLGGVSDLANTCRAWYSDRFDAESALQELVAEQGTAS